MTTFNKYSKLQKFVQFLSILVIVTGLGACSTTMESMDAVNQNLDEGRLVPAAAVAVPDILNQYDFHYPEPHQAAAALKLELDRKHVYTGGNTAYAQLALVTKHARPRPFHLHVLIYDDDHRDDKHRAFVSALLRRLQQKLATSNTHITLSVDSNYPLTHKLGHFATLNKKHTSSLKTFLADRSLQHWPEGANHFLLLAGTIKYLASDDAQDIADIGRILAARHSTLSILSYGEKPRFALLKSLAKHGHGYVNFRNKFTDTDAVLQRDFANINAYRLQHIKIRITPLAGTVIEKVVSPQGISVSDKGVKVDIPAILSGQQYVALLKIKLPVLGKHPAASFLKARLSYFNTRTKQYATAQAVASAPYSMNINATLPTAGSNVARSRLILATQTTLEQVADAIRQGRNYMAIAEITKQRRALSHFLAGRHDMQLARDAKILDKYAVHLRHFDQAWFQTFKIWKDMNWDRDRFTTQYD